MPAILTENFFMTNQDECVNLLMKDEEVRRIALFHYEAMIDCLKLSF
jgi:N-acetylmuramoyl-L-alanine amidase